MLKLPSQAKFNDSEAIEKAKTFANIIFGTATAISLTAIILWIIFPANYLRWLSVVLIFSSIGSILLYLNKKGHTRLASIMYVMLCMFMVLGFAWTTGGIKAPVIQNFAVIVLLAGLLLGWKAGIVTGLFSVLGGLVLVLADYWALLPERAITHNAISLWIISIMNIGLLALLQYVTVAKVNKSLGAAQKELELRTRTEGELIQSEAFRKRVFDTSRIPIVVMDAASFEFIDCNQAAIEIYGFSSREETLGKTPIHVSAPTQYDGSPSAEKAKYYIEKAFSEDSVVFEWKHQRPNGEFWDADVHLTSFISENKQFLQFTMIDITERKMSELSLRESESLIKSISNNFTSGMIYQVIVKQDGTRKFTYLSDSVTQLYGITPAEGLADATLIYKQIHKDDIAFLIEKGNEAMRTLSTFKAEVRVLDTNGAMRWSSFVSTPVRMEDGSVCFDGIEFVITERKQAEMELKKSEEKFSVAFRSSPTAMIITRIRDNQIIDINLAFEKLSGFKRYEIVGHLSTELNTWVDLEDRERAIQTLKEVGKLHDIDFDFRSKEGNISSCRIAIEMVQLGDETCMLTNIVDLTESKEAEISLRESEEMFKTLSSMASEGIMIQEKGIILVANKVFANMVGFENPQEIIGKNGLEVINFFTPESKELVIEHVRNRSNDPYDIETINNEGKVISAETRGVDVVYKGINARLVNMRDVTGRKNAENALKESEKLFRNLIQYAPYPMALTNLENRYQIVNKAFCKVNKVLEDDVLGKTPAEVGIIIDPSIEAKIAQEMESTGIVNNLDIRVIGVNGQHLDFLFSSRIIYLKNEPMILNSTIDITEKKAIDRELEDYRNRLELLVKERTEELNATVEELNTTNEELYNQKSELEATLYSLSEAQNLLIQSEKMVSLGILSAGIAHEINNPLNFINGGILGINNYLEEHIPEHLQNVKPLINAINVGVRRAAAIVTSLSHYSRTDDITETNCDIHAIIDNCLIMLQNQLKNKVEVTKHYTEKAHGLFGNEGKLHQAILNIIANAEQAIETTGEIAITTEVINHFLTIIIGDSGSGISTENLQKIFDPFFTTKAPGKGTGLGLSITFNIIKDHRGTLEYESQPGKGTKAIIKLPIQ